MVELLTFGSVVTISLPKALGYGMVITQELLPSFGLVHIFPALSQTMLITTGGTQNEPDNYAPAAGGQDGLAIALNAWPTHMAAGQGLGVAGQWNDIRDVEILYYLIEHDTVLSNAAPAQIEDSRVFVYNNQLFIEAVNTPIASVVLYDLTGKIVFSLATEAIPKPIDVSQFVTGIYLAEIFAQNGNTFVQRVKM